MKFIAYDLGTGGVKASLFDENCHTLFSSFTEYNTFYPSADMHEQRPADWWEGVIKNTSYILKKTGIHPKEIKCVSISGHSLIVLPIDKNFSELQTRVPIWSDCRAIQEAGEFFTKIDPEFWYKTTGNGFPPSFYSIFKLMWLKKHYPEIYEKTFKVLGSKDYINFKLTGQIYTDYSYASGTGAYDLLNNRIMVEFLEAAAISPDIFPPVIPSHQIIGTVTKQAAIATGLYEGTAVACGGVDNSCMALGISGIKEGSIFISLGSSSWIPINTKKPLLDSVKKPYVFTHIEETVYTSAFSIFSSGSSLRWLRDVFCKDISCENAYKTIDSLAEKSPVGAGGILFNPSLAGGTSHDISSNIRGAFLGLNLGTTREDMIRAVMEGISLNLRICMDYLKDYTNVSNSVLVCGGGSKSPFWMQILADVLNAEIIKTNIDQDASSVGAAAICARATGVWKDYSPVSDLHKIEHTFIPSKINKHKYEDLLNVFIKARNYLAEIGDLMQSNQSL